MMIHTRKLALAVCLVWLCLSSSASKAQVTATGQLDPTQTYTTGNIVLGTPQGGPTPWVGGVYQDNLTCWAGGDPGYCGPSPIVRPGGSINFSYGSSYIYQQQLVSSLLPSSTGLQINGYNFGFMAKNGNGWDDGRQDNLTALVRFWDNTGGRSASNLLYGNTYNLNYKFDWTSFNYSETFASPLAVPSLGQVQYGFIGNDNNFWAGPYGPEIYNVSFSLKYKVDPCATNPLYSATCPGYLEALAKLAPAPAPVVAEAPPPPPPMVDSNPISPTGQPLPPPGSPPVADFSQPPPPPAGPAPAGAPPPPGPPQQVASTQPAPSATQTKIGEVSDSSGGSKTTVSLSSVLSMIGSNQEKTAALEKSVVQAADAQAFSAGETAKQTAEKVAGEAQSQSIANSTSSTSSFQFSTTQSSSGQLTGSTMSVQGNQQSNMAAVSSRLQQSLNAGDASQTGSYTSVTNTQTTTTQNTVRQEFSLPQTSSPVSYSIVAPTRYTPQNQIELPMTYGIKFGYRSPVDSAMESKPFLPDVNMNPQQTTTVKRNVQNNEAAGNVTVESMAKQPTNYAQYFVAMPDTSFYAPKEIYKNQKTVDNVSVLRQMSSDRLHQEMVNSQYK